MRVVGSCARPPAPSALLFPHTAAGTTARLRRGRIAREPRAGRSEAGLELAFKDEVGPGHPRLCASAGARGARGARAQRRQRDA